ncbi:MULTISPECIES: prepilin-type N-terminal cleavage/methylation domain-containing protein [unclassified Sporolactobacillus]|uniref:prepilin-type N-terminal cleavage/methylation domain-containing protein n=1 Tax=unclassified Sporolactobacillus TaxID=2628533 RepID=UPI0023686CF2|nr:prepilin-type N-terminal cleavage/methylation domain-containing protein [Sporolactobacillus sp. CQH2019]MDD9150782.1 prepilin-type N-terminal cleavage/methylation domain-containing protein [Sporolactobacillus sp. CQH2019]
MRRNSLLRPECGFTVLELLIVVSIACILAPVSFLTFSRLSDAQSMRQFVEDVRDTISEAQMEAIAESTPITIIFNTDQHFFLVSKRNETLKKAMDPRIRLYSNVNKSYILISRIGSFSQPGTYTFTMNTIRYNLVLLLGQGRFYIDKAKW